MIWPDKKSPEERFDEALKAFAARTPRQAPAEAAAIISRQIRQPRQYRITDWALTTAAACLLAAVGTTLLWKTPRDLSTDSSPLYAGVQPLSQGEVLLWIDEETPLYMTFQPPDGYSEKGEKP
jgi:hypothetical protein